MNFLSMKLFFLGTHHGFGLNFNIFETNIINLVIVIALTVRFVGDVLQELLENRKNTILQNINFANTRAKQIKEQMDKVKMELDDANKKASTILDQGLISADREMKLCLAYGEEESHRLKQNKKDSIALQQQKFIRTIAQTIILIALKKVRTKTIKGVLNTTQGGSQEFTKKNSNKTNKKTTRVSNQEENKNKNKNTAFGVNDQQKPLEMTNQWRFFFTQIQLIRYTKK